MVTMTIPGRGRPLGGTPPTTYATSKPPCIDDGLDGIGERDWDVLSSDGEGATPADVMDIVDDDGYGDHYRGDDSAGRRVLRSVGLLPPPPDVADPPANLCAWHPDLDGSSGDGDSDGLVGASAEPVSAWRARRQVVGAVSARPTATAAATAAAATAAAGQLAPPAALSSPLLPSTPVIDDNLPHPVRGTGTTPVGCQDDCCGDGGGGDGDSDGSVGSGDVSDGRSSPVPKLNYFVHNGYRYSGNIYRLRPPAARSALAAGESGLAPPPEVRTGGWVPPPTSAARGETAPPFARVWSPEGAAVRPASLRYSGLRRAIEEAAEDWGGECEGADGPTGKVALATAAAVIAAAVEAAAEANEADEAVAPPSLPTVVMSGEAVPGAEEGVVASGSPAPPTATGAIPPVGAATAALPVAHQVGGRLPESPSLEGSTSPGTRWEGLPPFSTVTQPPLLSRAVAAAAAAAGVNTTPPHDPVGGAMPAAVFSSITAGATDSTAAGAVAAATAAASAAAAASATATAAAIAAFDARRSSGRRLSLSREGVPNGWPRSIGGAAGERRASGRFLRRFWGGAGQVAAR